MSGGETDLTGEWTGMYSYPRDYPPNAFEASIRDCGGVITGVFHERAEFAKRSGIHQHAVIEGVRTGSEVRWVKIYDDLTRDTPHYRGTILPGGDEIEGQWHIPGSWSGRFMMIRRCEEAIASEREVSEEIGAR